PVFRDRSPTDKTLNYYRHRPNMYGAFTKMEVALTACRRLVSRAEKQNVKVTIVILPVHALLLETLDHAKLWSMWEEWKRSLVRMATPAGTIWDFQNYHSYATEVIVEGDGAGSEPFLFFDPSHPSINLCAQVVDRVFGEIPDQSKSKSFGKKLSPDNLDSWLSEIRAERVRYAVSFPAQVESVLQILERPGRRAKSLK
ncbi:MAG: hypothetical protein ACI97A_004436, partial [Planctomycetota bacterium]